MTAPQDHDGELINGGGTPALIVRNKSRILDLFCERVQHTLPGARASPHPVMIDTLPAFITRLALALSPQHREIYASQYSNIAFQHGNERARFTPYTLKEVIKEYQFLREILAELLQTEGSATPREWAVVHRSIDEGIAEATSAFVAVQEGVRELFTATLTHDFRGPLQAALNFIELLRRPLDASQREQFATRSADNLRRIDRMIVELLDVSRSNAGERMTLEFSEREVGALMRDVLDDVAVRAGNRLVFEAEGPVVAYLNEEKMRQALNNLVENAVKYGDPESKITARVIESHGRVVMSVHNFGNPIPPAEQLTLFVPYRRASNATRGGKSGWGLGLALVQAIAEAHGGSVAVESTPEDGTTFSIDVLVDPRDLETERRASN
jgi:signal transduction histidine kinase